MNLLVCIDNTGFEASLEARKIYRQVDDPRGADLDMVRVVDESGEDYLYAASLFQPISVEERLKRQLFAKAA